MILKQVMLLALMAAIAIPAGIAYAQTTDDGNSDNTGPGDLLPPEDQNVGPVGYVFDVTELGSYDIHPEETRDLLHTEPDEPAITAEFATAFDEIHLIALGYEENINQEHVEFLEELDITLFGKSYGNVIEMSVHPSQEARIGEFETRLGEMYPGVDIQITTSVGAVYVDTYPYTSTVNTAIPNGGGSSVSDAISVTDHATLNSMSVSITVDHEDHDEMYMKLTSPAGREITVFSRERGHADGVQTFTYSSTTNSDLARLAGTDIFGDWTLNVRDAYTGSDTGTLQRWSLNFDATPTAASNTDGSNSNGAESSNENLLEQFFNLIFGDTTCNSTRDDCVPKVGGTYISYIGRDGTERHSSVGLGGLTTDDGKEGFIMAGHAPGHGNVGKIISHEMTTTGNSPIYTKPLGEVTINNNKTSINSYLRADVAFVEYPKECKTTETQLCYGETGEYKPTVNALEIFKSSGQTYTVTSTDRYPTRGDSIRATGYVSGELSGTIYDDSRYIPLPDGGYTYLALATFNVVEGDSGGPVYSVPNSDDEVKMEGIISVRVEIGDNEYAGYTPWYKIDRDLGLQSIP